MVPLLGSPVEKLTRRMFTRIITAVARTLREHDLSVGQLALLYLLDERAALRMSDVATELDLSLPTTSRLVDDLVRQSLVARHEDPTDRRARTLSLTTNGRAFIAKSSKARMATIAGATADMPASAIKALWSLGKPK
jgi:DNA-binding MarR family transcriptional regulator